jgi:LysM repeat protein
MSSTEPTTSAAGVAPTLHVVRAGETLILIAKRHGVTFQALLANSKR